MAKIKGSNGGGSSRIGRDAKSGHFIPVAEAKRRPSTTTVKNIKHKPKGK